MWTITIADCKLLCNTKANWLQPPSASRMAFVRRRIAESDIDRPSHHAGAADRLIEMTRTVRVHGASMSDQSKSVSGPWRRYLRVSVRGLIALLLVIGIWLGWIVRNAG